jgi:CheY-like chemotaxis protein
VPDALSGDMDRLRQILVNLVGNAVKFTERGEVIVTVAAMPVTHADFSIDSEEYHRASSGDPMPAGCHLKFSVSDTGIGVPREKQRAIFDPFVQADGSTTRLYGGTGLGLAITTRLVEMMGGRIWLDSVPGQGSVFHFTVRLKEQPLSRSMVLAPQPIHLRGMKVLVVDDNAASRRILQAMLSQWQMRPTLVGDGMSALAALRQAADGDDAFPLVLIDARMPGLDGFALAEQIQLQADLPHMALLLMSTTDQLRSVERSQGLGIAGHLTKPINPSDLLRVLQTVLDQVLLDAKGRVIVRKPKSSDAFEPPTRTLRVLLAEDNAINQRVSKLLLEKHGCRVQLANNGKEVLTALQEQSPFDLILMDVQMPVMDGYEATAHIRRHERGTERHLPIIALTAHAMRGDFERCLAVGMDGFLTKPINVKQFRAVLAELAARKGVTPPDARMQENDEEPTAELAVLDREALLARLDGDRGILNSLLQMFWSESARLEEAIRKALASKDASALALAAHSLKGMMASLAALAATERALELERVAREGDFAAAERIAADLPAEFAKFGVAMTALMEESHEYCSCG